MYMFIYVLHILKTKKRKLLIFSYRLLDSFLQSPGPLERQTDNCLLVTKFQDSGRFNEDGGGMGGGGG